MARTLTEIYNEAKQARLQYLKLSEAEISNPSKMSVMDAITWVTSSCIWTLENLMDVFKVDLAYDLQNRVNGTPAYYANALLKFQYGDDLVVSEDGTQFSYASVNTKKRIITKVSYSENAKKDFLDKELYLKVAKGENGNYSRLSTEELIAAKKYLSQIVFAGTHYSLVSLKGDILIPKLNVYYDGLVSSSSVLENIRQKLNDFIKTIPFDGSIYLHDIIQSILSADHVVDVDHSTSDDLGVFVVQFNDDGLPILVDGNKEQKIHRHFKLHSGYVRESTGKAADSEADILTWDKSITLLVEER